MTVRVVEFFSGIGGMHYGLDVCAAANPALRFDVVSSFDINPVANTVYQHNRQRCPVAKDIKGISVEDFASLNADLWVLSPPCQPYTRTGLRRDHLDARAAPLCHLIHVLSRMQRPPMYILVENVVNFEASQSMAQLRNVLRQREFVVQVFVVCPTDLGIPNSRRRCYVLAKRQSPFAMHQYDYCLVVGSIPGRSMVPATSIIPLTTLIPNVIIDADNVTERKAACDTVEDDDESDTDRVDSGVSMSTPYAKEYSTRDHACAALSEYLEVPPWAASLMIPESVVRRHGQAMDIVTPTMRKSNCFTKGYGSYVTGTGSVLLCDAPAGAITSKADADQLKFSAPLPSLSLRYFSPREIANLQGFPSSFEFPDSITLKQRYRLLGNSLNCSVVGSLLSYLLSPAVCSGVT